MDLNLRGVWWAILGLGLSASALPTLEVTRDDTVIRESCQILIHPGTVIRDANTNGVLHLAADDLVVRFLPGTELRGAPPDVPGNERRGIGIRIDGHQRVTLEDLRVHGYFNGLVGTRCDGLTVAGGDFSDNYRQRLRSTPQAEDDADWLFPHHNDDRKWREEYGSAVCIEDARAVTLREIRVRRGQNGIVLDRVLDSRIYDNDASFLSGWGIALWRSSRNVVSRNAFDFCVRGHVEGVYNRGQDSAGILCFEQCNQNVFAENSATHGGDGFFGFAGREALGDLWMDAERARLRQASGKEDVDDQIRVPRELALELSARGCNSNLLSGNDFSYAAAHGIEMTFSERNTFIGNRVVENAICGLWGGYSSESAILDNRFERNGGMAYGLERGAINMEHAADNLIAGNLFLNNKCGVHLWWDDDAALLKSPGVAGNDRGVSGNVIAGNRFELNPNHPFGGSRSGDKLVVLQLRGGGTNHVRDNRYFSNVVTLAVGNAVEFAVEAGCQPATEGILQRPVLPPIPVFGGSRPVGNRPALQGRDKIILDEWGPWDHEHPLVREAAGEGGRRSYDIFGVSERPVVEVLSGSITPEIAPLPTPFNTWRMSFSGPEGISSYTVRLRAPGLQKDLHGTSVVANWDCLFFPWTTVDPRENAAGWRRLAEGTEAVRVSTSALDLPYGWGGPRDLHARLGAALRDHGPGGDHFGMIARTRLVLPKGEWRFVTLSDDGVRVSVNGRKVIENWTWHGPTRDQGTYAQEATGPAEIEVEHFEIDGFSVLKLEIEPGD